MIEYWRRSNMNTHFDIKEWNILLDKFLEPASTLVGLPAKAKAGCIIYIYFKEASIFYI